MPALAGIFEQVSGCRLPGEEQNFASGKEVANLDGGVDSVHVRHDYIADDQIGPGSSGALDGRGAGINCAGIVSVLIENNSQSVGDDPFVIRYQHLWFCPIVAHIFAPSTIMSR